MSLMPIQVPNIRLPATDNWDGLSKLGAGLGKALDGYFQRQALAAAEPQVEETTTERPATAEEQERAAAETQRRNEELAREFVSDITDPQERETAYTKTLNDLNRDPQGKPVSWVDPNGPATQTGFKVGELTFQQRPTPAALNAIKYEKQADVFQQRGDPYRAGLLMAQAAQERAKGLEATFNGIDQTQDVDAAIRLYSDIPDGFTAAKRELPDGRIQVVLHPDGRPDETRTFATGTPEDIFKAIKNTLKPGSWEAAALAQEARDRQRLQYQRQEEEWQRAAENRQIEDLNRAIEAGRQGDMDSMQLGELIQRRDAIINRRAALGTGSGAAVPLGGSGSLPPGGPGATPIAGTGSPQVTGGAAPARTAPAAELGLTDLPEELAPYTPFLAKIRTRESAGNAVANCARLPHLPAALNADKYIIFCQSVRLLQRSLDNSFHTRMKVKILLPRKVVHRNLALART